MPEREPTLDLRVVAHPGLDEPQRLLVEAIVDELDQAGTTPQVVDDVDGGALGDHMVFVVVDPWRHRRLGGVDVTDQPGLLPRTVLVLVDADVGSIEERIRIEAAAAVFCLDDRALDLMRLDRTPSHRLVPGTTRRWRPTGDRPPRDLRVESRAVPSAHRFATLARCADVLAGGSATVTFDDGDTPLDRAPHPPVLETLDRADVSLLLQTDPTPSGFDWLRASLAMHRGAVVLAERAPGTSPLVAGTHVVSSSADHLPTVLEHLLADDATRRRIADAASAWLDEHPLARSIDEMVAVLRAAGDAPPPTLDGSAITRPAPTSRQPRVKSEDTEAKLIRRILREVRLDLFEVQREQRRAALRAEGVDTATVETVWDSPAYGEGTPTVSVVTASFQHAGRIGAAIGSIAAGGYDDLEMIVVDDGSTDETEAAVVAEASEHGGLALRLLRHPVNRGLGPARNTALDHVRGEFVFVLDADNLVHPAGIGRLVDALTADPDAAAAYGLLQRFGPHGPTGLADVFAWWPERFRSGNYIDAMALFRTDVVHALGGYTTDRRLYGWEDYDLWCGIAASGRHAVRVPNVVAGYRVSGTSMVTISDYSNFAAYSALAERHPGLMGGIQPQD